MQESASAAPPGQPSASPPGRRNRPPPDEKPPFYRLRNRRRLDGDADEQSRRSLTEVLETVRGSLGAEDEEIVRSRIAAMHFARARAHEGLEAVQARTGAVREHDIDRVESDLRWWGMLLERATISGLGPGVQRFEQSIGRRIEQLPVKRIDDAMTLVIDGVSEAVQSFDPTRRTQGHNLDRSVGLTVSRRVARQPTARDRTAGRDMDIRDRSSLI